MHSHGQLIYRHFHHQVLHRSTSAQKSSTLMTINEICIVFCYVIQSTSQYHSMISRKFLLVRLLQSCRRDWHCGRTRIVVLRYISAMVRLLILSQAAKTKTLRFLKEQTCLSRLPPLVYGKRRDILSQAEILAECAKKVH